MVKTATATEPRDERHGGHGAQGAPGLSDPLAQDPDVTEWDVLIVGGGISGLLAALRLSRQTSPDVPLPRIVVMESKDALGGRLVLGNVPQSGSARSTVVPTETSEATPLRTEAGSFPFEIFGVHAHDVLEAFWELMTSQERESVVTALRQRRQAEGSPGVPRGSQGPSSAFAREARGTFVVRKEFTPGPLMCSGPTECLTRAAATALGEFLKSTETCRLRDAAFWKELRKPYREELRPFFETFAGDEFEKAEVAFLVQGIRTALGIQEHKSNEVADLTKVPVAEFCHEVGRVLMERGVEIRLSTRVERVERAERGPSLGKRDSKGAGPAPFRARAVASGGELQRVSATAVLATVPLSQSLVVVAREILTAAESKFVTRIRPRSAVALDVAQPFDAPEYGALGIARPGETCRFLFPIERVQALQTSDGRLIFYAWMDYETSLQAPGVREVLARLKRAFKRIFPETELETFARMSGATALLAASAKRPQGQSQSQSQSAALDASSGTESALSKPQGAVRRLLGERLVLIPVAQSVPPEPVDLPELPSVDAAPWGLTFIGEHFEGARGAWSSLIRSADVGAERVSRALAAAAAVNLQGQAQGQVRVTPSGTSQAVPKAVQIGENENVSVLD